MIGATERVQNLSARSAPCARAAFWYASHGLRAHPLRPGSKLPILDQWQLRATMVGTEIDEWWTRWPSAGVGIATGAESGVIVVDIDPRHRGDESLEELEREHGALPETWTSSTANGGRHFYFAHPGGRVGNRAGLLPGVDLRADGGYVVVPPTELSDGGSYSWLAGYGPHELALAPAPAWFVDLLRDDRAEGEARPPDEWVDLVRDGVREGGRNATIARLAGYLLRRRPAPRVVLELLRAWSESRCRPPLADDEVVRTVDSIAHKESARERRG